jgi:multiple sugar transport system permease protein
MITSEGKFMKKKYFGYYYCLPALIFMVAFVGYPIVYNVILSLQNCDISSFNSGANGFNHLQNYKDVFSNSLFSTALFQTMYFTFFCIILQFTLGLLFALFFNLKFRLAEPLRGLILVSWMIPLTVTGMLFKFMLSPSDGVINYIMLTIGLIKEPIGW